MRIRFPTEGVCDHNVMLEPVVSKALNRYTSQTASNLVKLVTMLAFQDPMISVFQCTESFRVFCFTSSWSNSCEDIVCGDVCQITL
ncbi:unnamed protein product [Albugo candida]|uniref:Uncharacterized protein n=1 Tax=Albugo candida TaxID=65357 RepID=A0A024GEB0_9STRA|nr:unnamed protein product [Albugo candida]|eukprot:CCI45213.1 unnamed protein product [Albugo candida]